MKNPRPPGDIFARCTKCGVMEHLHLLDGKDDNTIECIRCYGEGYNMLSPTHINLSIVPALKPLYKDYIKRSPK